MITEAVLKSWMEDNTSRSYPLSEDVIGTDTLPYPVIIGLSIQAPTSVLENPESSTPVLKDIYPFYIGEVQITPSDITVTVMVGDERIPVARAFATLTEMEAYEGVSKRYTIFPLEVGDPNLQGVSGDIFFGPIGVISSLQGIYILDKDSGEIDLSCIHIYPDYLRGLSINGKVLTGDITFVAGENVNLALEEGNIIISHSPPEVDGILSRKDLIEAITERYGVPICSINDVFPDEEGNLVIASSTSGEEEEDDSCVDIGVIDHGITLSNTCATPCCDRDEYMELIAKSIGELNARAARLSSYLESVTTNINSLQNELSILKLGINQE